SPSIKSISTSSPTRGQKYVPHPLPAQPCATRSSVLSGVFGLRSRSHQNCTFTRPYLSMYESSFCCTTTKPVCIPPTTGFCVFRGDRYLIDVGTARNLFA